jgi:hypothetical protein
LDGSRPATILMRRPPSAPSGQTDGLHYPRHRHRHLALGLRSAWTSIGGAPVAYAIAVNAGREAPTTVRQVGATTRLTGAGTTGAAATRAAAEAAGAATERWLEPFTSRQPWAALGPRTIGNRWSPADNSGKQTPRSDHVPPIAAGQGSAVPALLRQRSTLGHALLHAPVRRQGSPAGQISQRQAGHTQLEPVQPPGGR